MTTSVILSEKAARTLTDRIRKAGEDFGRLLLDAHEGEAWRAMGYATWQDYVAGEFTFTRAESYKLLTQERVSRAAGERVTQREAQAVVKNFTGVSHAIHDIPSAPSPEVQRLLAEQRALPKPVSRGHAVRGVDGLIASVRALDERLGTVADGRTEDDALPPDLMRVLQRLATTIDGLLGGRS